MFQADGRIILKRNIFMAITTILFDLDGTLLPMDQDIFVGAYIKGLAIAAAPHGYEPNTFSKAVIAGTVAMVKNDGTRTNEQAFWDLFVSALGQKAKQDMHIFDKFYQTDFQTIKDVCGFSPKASELIARIKAKGYRVALATNPLFPRVATESRMHWAGLEPDDFEMYTTYETSCYCKPNLEYYREVLTKLHVVPQECLMVGNDVADDMVAEQLGMKVFLLTDCLINKNNADISDYPHGNFDDLLAFVDTLER